MSKFSVLMSVYQKESPDFLQQSLESIYEKQTLKPTEIVVVEDGPLTDQLSNVLDLFSKIPDVNLKRIKLEVNSGLAVALNEGLRYCDNEFIARMDTDDISKDDRFEEQINFLINNSKIDVVGSYAIEFDENGKEGSTKKVPLTHDKIYNALWFNPFIHPSVVFRKQKILSIGGYSSQLNRAQDYELWFRCAVNHLRFANIPKCLIKYRVSIRKNTKQPRYICKIQGEIGYAGTLLLGQSKFKAVLCYLPFIKSFFPQRLQVMVAKFMDPRRW
jgi:glycosyltransferase involved in cell wall biosynthesis